MPVPLVISVDSVVELGANASDFDNVDVNLSCTAFAGATSYDWSCLNNPIKSLVTATPFHTVQNLSRTQNLVFVVTVQGGPDNGWGATRDIKLAPNLYNLQWLFSNQGYSVSATPFGTPMRWEEKIGINGTWQFMAVFADGAAYSKENPNLASNTYVRARRDEVDPAAIFSRPFLIRPAPLGLTAVNISANIELLFCDPADVPAHVLYEFATNLNFSGSQMGRQNASGGSFGSLSPNTQYYARAYYIQETINFTGEIASLPSSVITFTTLGISPPSGIVLSNPTDTSGLLTCNISSDVPNANVRWEISAQTPTFIPIINTQNLLNSGIPGSTYQTPIGPLPTNAYYFVRAYYTEYSPTLNGADISAYSEFVFYLGLLSLSSSIPNILLDSSSFRLTQGSNSFDLLDIFYPQTTPKARIKPNGVPGSSRIYYTGDGKPDNGVPYVLSGTLDQQENSAFLYYLRQALIDVERLVYTKVTPNLYLEIDTDLFSRGYEIIESSDRSWIGTISIVFNVKSPIWKRIDNNLEVGTVI